MNRIRFVSAATYFILAAIQSFAVAQKIYWVESGSQSIRKANLNGTDQRTVIQRLLYDPREIDIDPVHGKLYWADWNFYSDESWIARSNTDGSEMEFLIPLGDAYPFGLAVDSEAGKIYWSEYGANPVRGAIRRANLDGTDIETVISTAYAMGITLNNGKVYWSDASSISRANLDGSEPEVVIADRFAHDIAVDFDGGKIYWTEGYLWAGFSAKVWRANLDGTEIETLVTGLHGPHGISLDLVHGKMYWADNETNGGGLGAMRANLDGTNVETLRYGAANGIVVHAESGHVYWTNTGGVINRLSLNDDSISTVLTNEVYDPQGIAVDQLEGRVYWSDRIQQTGSEGLRRAFTDGTAVEQINAPMAWYEFREVSIDPLRSKIYRADTEGMRRSNLDGSDFQTVFDPTGYVAFPPPGLAVDAARGKAYVSLRYMYPLPSHNEIYRTDLDGTGFEVVLSSTDTYFGNLVLDSIRGHIYFSSCCSPRQIRRCDLDGANLEDIVTFESSGAFGLALDPIAEKLYWSTAEPQQFYSGVIQRSDFDGGNVEVVVAGLSYPTALALELPVHVIGSYPSPCAIDARQPFDPQNPFVRQGWNSIDLVLSLPVAALSPNDLGVEVIGGSGFAPEVLSVNAASPGVFRVMLTDTIEPGAWTCVVHAPTGTRSCLGSLPGDVNSDGYSGPADILRLIDNFNDQVVPELENWQSDIDRSGAPNALDILPLIDLLNGAGDFEPWNGQRLEACPL